MSPVTPLIPVFFDHIHKAGGTAVQSVLATHYGSKEVARADGPAETALREFEDFKVIAGHVTHRPDCWPFLQRYTFTILRNPIARALSVYYYFCRQVGTFARAHADDAQRPASEISFDEFVNGELHGSDLVSDFQTRHFAAMAVGPVREPLESAKAALERYHLVGTQESLEESVRILLADLQLPTTTPIPTKNVTPRYPGPDEIPASLRRSIDEKNALDLELWTWAQERFQERRALPRARIIVLSKASQKTEAPSEEIRGDDKVILIGAVLSACDGRESRFAAGEHLTLTIELWSEHNLPDVTVGFSISTESRRQVYGTNTHHLDHRVDIRAGETNQLSFEFPVLLAPGHYSIGFSCHTGRDTAQGFFLWREAVIWFDVTNPWLPEFLGAICLPTIVRSAPAPKSSPRRWMAPLPRDQVHAQIDLPGSPSPGMMRARPGQIVEVPIQVTNLSAQTLASLPPFPVSVSYHVKASDGSMAVFDGRRTALPAPILPASHIDMIAVVDAPRLTGVYTVELSLVQDGQFWFDELSQGLPKVVELTVIEQE